ncbi:MULTISPECIES: NAD(P)-dependent oxidoreductase [unclassified Chelatococcus]|uniref:2-hydroxyacid dehydrogenase n=1 Tax=unclassified Chelatococcus TaxID=2638111 RepID=UPI001BCA7782|nr:MULTISPECIES: NAD(P)-dependent oxidoreductase [unclassified Chelatococcus]CAH1651174.1 D-3-phosphoglycerate dehydrogenase [Hyphomicrobiales bacterium]MBS7743208.1 3-phosphoglycerate dehydrogenase [Chelatococcus sp. HY11]MBX3541674.1 3-phosphoglycerate dehydrogenase [Chelatococcus sp.]MCO5074434.1 3-phosphoglycerate dehydrogenase [Chelatococcus sp.]CAH1693075.1 D-3-phosphoglycerate dehydrogenase [Hyphomicrobiales bacterium]
MSICYIDCSPFMRELMDEVADIHAGAICVNVGDPGVDELVRLASGHDVLMNGHSFMNDDVLGRLPDLRRIVFLGSGASSYIDVAAAGRRGIEVLTVTGYGDRSVAEHATALMFAAARQLVRMDRAVRDGGWDPLEGIELAGRTIGIIGFGGIGQEMARIARALGMVPLIWNRRPVDAEWSACQATSLEQLLRESDVISLHLALTSETRGLLGGPEFELMKRGALLVNTARAGLIDQKALLDALGTGRLRHAALDVFDEEPLPPDNPYGAMDNVTLTAHAGFKTRAASRRLLRDALLKALAPVS